MKVHLRQIPQGEILHLEGKEEAAPLGLEEAGAEPIGQLEYSLDVGVSDGGLFATGSLAQRVRMTCGSCLESFELDVRDDLFAAQVELDGSELVDLTPEVREDIHLLLPAHPRCDLGGEKPCPAHYPVADRNSPIQVGRTTCPAVWEALDQLKTPPSDGSPQT